MKYDLFWYDRDGEEEIARQFISCVSEEDALAFASIHMSRMKEGHRIEIRAREDG